MRKLNPPKLVTVAVFTTITIIFWIFFSVYNILTSDAEVDVDPRLLEPIDPSLNTQVLEQLPEKNFYEESSTQSFNVYDADEITPEDEGLDESAEPTPTLAEDADEEVEEEINADTTPIPSPTETTTP